MRNFNIDADESDDELKIDDSPKINTVECENFYITGRKSSLIRARAKIELINNYISTPMLVDCGATSSLINPQILPAEEAKAISNYLEQGVQPDFVELRKSKITMKHAVGTTVAECAIGKVNLSVGDWKGSHEFIFKDIQEKAILGMDFLIKHKAIVDIVNKEIRIYENDREYMLYDETADTEDIKLTM